MVLVVRLGYLIYTGNPSALKKNKIKNKRTHEEKLTALFCPAVQKWNHYFPSEYEVSFVPLHPRNIINVRNHGRKIMINYQNKVYTSFTCQQKSTKSQLTLFFHPFSRFSASQLCFKSFSAEIPSLWHKIGRDTWINPELIWLPFSSLGLMNFFIDTMIESRVISDSEAIIKEKEHAAGTRCN